MAKRKFWGDLLFNKGHLEAARKLFIKYDEAVIFTRMIPGFRTIVSFPAGAVRMPIAKFVAYTTLGCLTWNFVLVGAGVYDGSNWAEIAGISRYLIIVSVVVVLTLVAILFIRRRNHAQKMKKEK